MTAETYFRVNELHNTSWKAFNSSSFDISNFPVGILEGKLLALWITTDYIETFLSFKMLILSDALHHLNQSEEGMKNVTM